MSISMCAAPIPVFKQILGSLSGILNKAEAHVADKKIDPNALLQARLYPDMFPLTRQIQIAADFAKGAAACLAGLAVPKYEDTEQVFAELNARIATTLSLIESIPAAPLDGSEEHDIIPCSGDKVKHFNGQTYLLHSALPAALLLPRHNRVRDPASQQYRSGRA